MYENTVDRLWTINEPDVIAYCDDCELAIMSVLTRQPLEAIGIDRAIESVNQLWADSGFETRMVHTHQGSCAQCGVECAASAA